jgi:hypothetical protein
MYTYIHTGPCTYIIYYCICVYMINYTAV